PRITPDRGVFARVPTGCRFVAGHERRRARAAPVGNMGGDVFVMPNHFGSSENQTDSIARLYNDWCRVRGQIAASPVEMEIDGVLGFLLIRG
ncbi:hypothetical protein, partial [Halogeometricum borinquense]